MSAPPAQHAREPILTLRYNGAAPPPPPVCTDPTPDEQFELEIANRARQQAEKEAAEASKPKDESALGKIGGFFNKAASTVEKAATSAHDSSERKVRQWEFEQGEKNFTVNIIIIIIIFIITKISLSLRVSQKILKFFFLSHFNLLWILFRDSGSITP